MRLYKILILALIAVPLAAQVPSPQINLSGNVGAIGFPILNSGTYQMPSDANVTFTGSNVNTSAFSIKITSAVSLTATRLITYPAGRFTLNIENATTGGQALSIGFGSGTLCSVPNSANIVTMWFDGTNCVQTSTSSSGTGTAPADLATTGSNITLSGEQTIDGVLTSSSRVLVKDQTTQSQNGCYASNTGAWTRCTDFAPANLSSISVTSGSINFNKIFYVTSPNPITVGTSAINFATNAVLTAAQSGSSYVGPCDILATASTPCVVAYSLARRMLASYSGNIFQLTRASDSTTTNVGTLSSGLVNAATATTFCSGTTCTISEIYDQISTSNLTPACCSPDGTKYAAPLGWTSFPGGLTVPVARITNGQAYQNAAGAPTGNHAISAYMMVENVSEGGQVAFCCGSFGDTESPIANGGNGAMFSLAYSYGSEGTEGTGNGPWAGVDLENGVFLYGATPFQNYLSILAKYNPTGTVMAIKEGDATQGRLTTVYNGSLPGGYTINLQGAVTLGMGGDASNAPTNFIEGAITATTTIDATDNSIQANLSQFYGPGQLYAPTATQQNISYFIGNYSTYIAGTTGTRYINSFVPYPNQIVNVVDPTGPTDCTVGGNTSPQYAHGCRWDAATKTWVAVYANTTSSGTVYPGAGVPNSNGSAWLSSYTAPTGNLVGTGQGNAYTTGSQDLTSATDFKIPQLSGAASATGQFHFNTTINEYEGYYGSRWIFPWVAVGGGTASQCAYWVSAYNLGSQACGSGGMVWPTSPGYALWQSGTSWSTPSLTDSGGNVNSSEPIVVNGSVHGITIPAGTAVSGAANKVVISSDATNGYFEVNENNTGPARGCTATNGVCGSGSGNTTSTSLTTNVLPKANGANSIVNSLVTDDGTTQGYSGTGGINASAGPVAGTKGYFGSPSTAAKAALPTGANGVSEDETTTAGVPASAVDYLRADATAHCWEASLNNSTESCTTTAATLAIFATNSGQSNTINATEVIVNGSQSLSVSGSGCSLSSEAGGLTAGAFTLTSVSVAECVVTVTLPTAPHGWACAINTLVGSDSNPYLLDQSATTTTSASFTDQAGLNFVYNFNYACTGY